ncbi:hypothetical protein QQS21_004173 [Conoideocrella luteorostrata]|uniref:Uncharacterized protein n=1 Tax=Conoideocrella luteorostrata TaxID=1105319 RepID=A0AAJ0CRW7_9HYPO|nr:hypothetical protein QQS21_004173 [Conoideocrella luteorostrata]
MNPGKSSNEHCWTAIYKVLFPDWEETRHIPSPYQDEQSRNSLDQQEILRDVRAIFCNPEVVDALRTREDVQGILQILEGGCEAFMARVRMQNSGQSESSASHPIQPQRRISSQPSIVTPAVAALPNSSIESAVSLTLLQDVPHQAVQEQETLQIPQEPFQYMPLPPPVQVNRPENHLQRQSYDGSLPHNGSAWSHYDPNFNFGFEGSDNTPFGDYDLRSSVDLGPSDDNRPLFLYGHDTMGPGVPLQFDEQDNDTRGHYSGMVVSHAVQASNPAYDSSTNSNAVQLPRATPRNGDGHAYANTSTISPVFKNNYKPGIAPYPSGVDMNCQNLSFGGRETT